MWRTILVPHDFSSCANRAAAIARDAALHHGGRILLLHVIDLPLAYGRDTTLVVPEDSQTPIGMRDYALTAGQAHLEDLVVRLAQDGVVAEAFVREGSPAAEIDTFAGVYEVTAIVMGTHGRTGIRHLLAGSVAERVVRTSSVPVVTVRGD